MWICGWFSGIPATTFPPLWSSDETESKNCTVRISSQEKSSHPEQLQCESASRVSSVFIFNSEGIVKRYWHDASSHRSFLQFYCNLFEVNLSYASFLGSDSRLLSPADWTNVRSLLSFPGTEGFSAGLFSLVRLEALAAHTDSEMMSCTFMFQNNDKERVSQ